MRAELDPNPRLRLSDLQDAAVEVCPRCQVRRFGFAFDSLQRTDWAQRITIASSNITCQLRQFEREKWQDFPEDEVEGARWTQLRPERPPPDRADDFPPPFPRPGARVSVERALSSPLCVFSSALRGFDLARSERCFGCR